METRTLTEKFIRVSDLMRRAHRKHRMERRTEGPHRGQGRILLLLKNRPMMSQRELSYILDMRAQSLGEILAKLEASGYITRAPSADDRRAMDITLTEAGAEAAKELEAVRKESGKLFDSLSAEEQDTLSGLLDKLIRALEEQVGDDDICVAMPNMRNFGEQMQDIIGRKVKNIIKKTRIINTSDDEDDDGQNETKIVTIKVDKDGNTRKKVKVFKNEEVVQSDDEDGGDFQFNFNADGGNTKIVTIKVDKDGSTRKRVEVFKNEEVVQSDDDDEEEDDDIIDIMGDEDEDDED